MQSLTFPAAKSKNGHESELKPGSPLPQERVCACVLLENVSKYYYQGGDTIRAVNDVSLEVYPGDFLIITGRSGSGKTTLLSLIGGLTTPTAGTVRVFDHDLSQLDDAALSNLRAQCIGFNFQFASLLPTLTALDNVRLPGLFASKPVSEAAAGELLNWVGLADKMYGYPAELSGGQQARVALARALANQPYLLLADEPTGNLDVDTEREILSRLRELNQTRGTTILLVTHNPELAVYGNRLLRMHRGTVEELDR